MSFIFNEFSLVRRTEVGEKRMQNAFHDLFLVENEISALMQK